jgi:hypothetical protein
VPGVCLFTLHSSLKYGGFSMNKILILILMIISISCNSNKQKTDNDTVPDTDKVPDIEIVDEDSDETPEEVPDVPDEEVPDEKEHPDIDMHCPLPIDAGYPYYREDGTIHFCRPCDTPDEYDPQCIKSLWKDLNKEAYDMYKAGKFPDNEYIGECYPWPCEWNVEPRDPLLVPTAVHECDIFLNPRTWANSFRGSRKESNMENGKIVFWITNYRYSDVGLPVFAGYAGQRTVMYDIEAGKYTVLGLLTTPAYMNGIVIANSILVGDGELTRGLFGIVSVVPYKESFKYEVIYTNVETDSMIDASPYITDKWTIMVVTNLDRSTHTLSNAPRSLVYSRTGEWNWKTLAYGNPDGKAGELSISGDRAMFVHYATESAYICDLSKEPKDIIKDCRKIGREGEIAGFPKFDRDNPDRIAYRIVADGIPRNRFVIMDISKEPWKIEKEMDIPISEERYIKMSLMGLKSDLILYMEDYLLPTEGYEQDGKLCFYRIDKKKTYCSKPIEGQRQHAHGHPAFEGKYLFWQPMFDAGYILRDMECYCEKEGVCPFEE